MCDLYCTQARSASPCYDRAASRCYDLAVAERSRTSITHHHSATRAGRSAGLRVPGGAAHRLTMTTSASHGSSCSIPEPRSSMSSSSQWVGDTARIEPISREIAANRLGAGGDQAEVVVLSVSHSCLRPSPHVDTDVSTRQFRWTYVEVLPLTCAATYAHHVERISVSPLLAAGCPGASCVCERTVFSMRAFATASACALLHLW